LNLREIRKQLGLTMKQVARLTGISEPLVCLIESGARRPSVKVAKRLSEVYGIRWEDFYKDI
jgi:transcriptional regulator with XRE-family HTH domain